MFTFFWQMLPLPKSGEGTTLKWARELPADLHLMNAIDRLASPAMLIGADSQVVHMNAAMTALAGAGNPPTQTLYLQDLLADDAGAAAMQMLGVATSGTGQHLRFVMRTGEHDLILSPVQLYDGRSHGFLANAIATNVFDSQIEKAADEVERWRPLLARLHDGTWDVNYVTGERYHTAGWREMRGLAPDDTSRDGRNCWLKHVHPDDIARIDALNARIVAEKLPTFDIEFREKHADGHWMWIACHGLITRWTRHGEPLHAIGAEKDITESKLNAERVAHVKTLEQRWEIGVERTGNGLWDQDRETQNNYVSDHWCAIRGYGPGEIQHSLDTWLARIHPDDIRHVQEHVKQVDTGRVDDICHEYRERHRDGHWVWILSRGRVVSRDAQGQPVRIIGTDTDITQIKMRTQALGSVSKSLELAVTTAGIGVWEFDIETGEEKWNRQTFLIFGIDPDKPKPPGNLWEMHLHPDDREKAISASNASLKSGEDFIMDYRIVRPNGDVRYVRARASQLVDHTGARKLSGVIWDVTSDFENAATLRKAHDLAREQNIALEAARAQMEHDARHDTLTGLANRRRLEDIQAACVYDDSCPAALHIDLDRFKHINDTLGHGAGDKILIHAATILRRYAPEKAVVARMGGDEFVIYLPDAPNDDALAEMASAIIRDASEPYLIDKIECRFGISIGIATARSGSGKGPTLCAHADLALYLAKNEGRGRYRFYTEDLKITAQKKRRLADEILNGLERKEFYCVYQPQFEAQTLDLSGVEALVRWRHPSGEIWTPDRFLPLAEELDVVARIDQLVLQDAVADMHRWKDARLPVPRMSVNVSSRRLTDPDLPKKLEFLEGAPGAIAFELLESVFLDTHDAQLSANLAFIRKMGIHIEVDDFGTGHASIVGLLKLRPERLKIDRELVDPVVTSQRQRLLVRSIVEIGKLQGIAVVAEGVETAAHINVLRSLGCDYLQGYGLASPMPADDLKALLQLAYANDKYRPFADRKAKA